MHIPHGAWSPTVSFYRQAIYHIANADRKQPGDPARAAHVMLQVVQMEHPPLRLPLGNDTLQVIRQPFKEAGTLLAMRGLPYP
jgi:hypothetical protein